MENSDKPYSFTLDHKFTDNMFSLDSILIIMSMIIFIFLSIYDIMFDVELVDKNQEDRAEALKLKADPIFWRNMSFWMFLIGMILFFRARS